MARMAFGPHGGDQNHAEKLNGNGRPGDFQVGLRQRRDSLRGAAQPDDRRDVGQQQRRRQGQEKDGGRDAVAERDLGPFLILRAEIARDLRSRADADQGAEGDDQQNDGEDDGNGGQPLGADVMADEDAVDDVVKRVGQHPERGRQGEAEDQAGNGRAAHQSGSVRHLRQERQSPE